MSSIDLLRPREPVDVGARSSEVAELTQAFNEMLARLDHERRESARRAQSAQEQERRALSLELHDEIGQNRRLRPEALDDLGLISAIDHLCERVGNDSGLAIERSLDPGLPGLSSDAQLVVYRVTQESLTNVVRHSGACRAIVELESCDDGVRLRVADDGAGTPSAENEGSGIRGMRERALMIGAALHVGRGAPTGTEVVLDIPAEELRP